MLIAPWFWRENGIIKRPPDAPAINALGERLAGMMPKQNNPNQRYRPVQSMQRKGQLQDWYYTETGTIQYMAEVGAEIQPDAEGMRQVVDDNLAAVWYMMDLALGLEGLDGFGTLSVFASDTETSEPLEVPIYVDGSTHPILKQRSTNPINGRFDWLLPVGEHSINLDRWDYEDLESINVEITSGERTELVVELERSNLVDCSIRTLDARNGQLIPSRVQIKGPGRSRVYYMNPYAESVFDLTLENGNHSFALPSRFYLFQVTAVGYLPIVEVIQITEGSEIDFSMPQSDIVYLNNFDSDNGWRRGGDGEDWGVVAFNDRRCLTESVSGDYRTDTDSWLQLDDIAQLDSARATLRIIHRPYFEPGVDRGTISWFTNPDDVRSFDFSRMPEGWDTLYISLDPLEQGNLQVNFRVSSDHAIGEDGWLIDQIAVYMEEFEDEVTSKARVPSDFSFTAFPNPFNSTTTIEYALPYASDVTLNLYNLSGQRIETLVKGRVMAGVHQVTLNACNTPSGLYFAKLEGVGQSYTQKIMLVK